MMCEALGINRVFDGLEWTNDGWNSGTMAGMVKLLGS